MTLHFEVEGKASPSGSKKAFINKHTGRISVVDTAKNKDSWQSWVRLKATEAARDAGIEPSRNPFSLTVVFFFARPRSHFGTGKNADKLKPSAPLCHTQKPDVTKLMRCTEDALKGIAWHDDSQVAQQTAEKHWHHNRDLVVITLREIPETPRWE